jgi:glucose-1-phosphate cytidylyltransferase
MKVVILCGGRGTRLYPDTESRPKPMIEIGGHPILWHIMKIYSFYGYNEFILALGYKGDNIKRYFLNYHLMSGDVKLNLKTGHIEYSNKNSENWNIQMVDTGLDTLTGGRLARLEPYLQNEDSFMLTYGDGVADINIKQLVDFHVKHGRTGTVSAVRPAGRFGVMDFDGDKVIDFHEKPQVEQGWINGGFFIFKSEIFNYLSGDKTILEREPLENLVSKQELMSFKHKGYWHCMDTPRDRDDLNEVWENKTASWKIW